MSRISLRETYDNRSVIAQIAKVTDTAEDAAETVEQKAAEINDALTDVNAAVQAAEGAVTTANAASASAQQSAQTVAGYNTRLTTAEGEIDTLQSDLNSVTLRVQTAEGNIVTIQGRVTALETADGQNVKLTGEHAIGNYAVLLTNNQSKNGVLTMNTGINGIKFPVCDKVPENIANKYIKLFSITRRASMLMFTVKTATQYMTVLADMRPNTVSVRTEIHGTTPDRFANTDIIVMSDDTKYYFFMKYPQNRKFVLDFDNANPLFGNGTDSFVDIDTGFFDRVLVDEPEIGGEYTAKYLSGAM